MQDAALWAFLGGENKHHMFTLNLLLALLTQFVGTILHENASTNLLTSVVVGRTPLAVDT